MRSKPPTRFAVLDDCSFYAHPRMLHDTGGVLDCVQHPLEYGRSYGLEQIWIYAPTPAAAAEQLDRHQRELPPGWTLSTERPGSWWLSAYRPGLPAVELCYPALNGPAGDWQAWAHAATPEQLCGALACFRDATGFLPERSPGATSLRLLLRSTKTPQRAARAPVIAHGGPLSWRRPLTPDEAHCRYVHAYDKHAAYLAACSSLAVGVGMPRHTSVEAVSALLARLPGPGALPPGLWRLAPAAAFQEPSPDAPPCVYLPKSGGWVATPTLRLLIEHGHPLEVEDAWIWPSRQRTLRLWYERLRAARKTLGQATDADAGAVKLAKTALKSCYTQGIGWFAAVSPSWTREDDPWYRTDVFAAIVATARCNIVRNMAALAQQPFAIATDCAYFATDTASPVSFAATIGLRLGADPGEWGIEHAQLATAEMPRDGGIRALAQWAENARVAV